MLQKRNAGLAMLDVLVALLLLALTLTGACVTLVQAMRASHGALLATRAADLAADLTEDLQTARSPAQADALMAAWRRRVALDLPVADMEPGEFASLRPVPPAALGDPPTVVEAYELRLGCAR
jgi:Tfp pilus assembly protein PilV